MTILQGMLIVAATIWGTAFFVLLHITPTANNSTACHVFSRWMWLAAGVLVGGLLPLIPLIPALIVK